MDKQQVERLKLVKSNIQAAQEKQNKDYDRKNAKPTAYQVGKMVLVKDHTRKKERVGNWIQNGLVYSKLTKFATGHLFSVCQMVLAQKGVQVLVLNRSTNLH